APAPPRSVQRNRWPRPRATAATAAPPPAPSPPQIPSASCKQPSFIPAHRESELQLQHKNRDAQRLLLALSVVAKGALLLSQQVVLPRREVTAPATARNRRASRIRIARSRFPGAYQKAP